MGAMFSVVLPDLGRRGRVGVVVERRSHPGGSRAVGGGRLGGGARVLGDVVGQLRVFVAA